MSAVKDITPQEAHELVQAGKRYLDVRTAEEFEAGHAPGAINIPVMLKGDAGMSPNPDFLDSVKAVFQDTTETIVVGCRSGARSTTAGNMMASQAGFKDLLNVQGGFGLWASSGLPTTN